MTRVGRHGTEWLCPARQHRPDTAYHKPIRAPLCNGHERQTKEAVVETWFYHCERRAVDQVVSSLLQKTLAKGWRAVVMVPDEEELARVDDMLWTFEETAFLPHGRADAPDAARQPVLVSLDGEASKNGAQLLLATGGAMPPEDGGQTDGGFERAVIVFADDDQHVRAAARQHWKNLRDRKQNVSYWREGKSGSWERQG